MRSKTELYSLFINTFPEGWFMAVDGKVSGEVAEMILEHRKKGHKVEWVLMTHETAALQAYGAHQKEYTFEEYFEMRGIK